jgi:RNA polymerase sigma-70 factor (ECF subfamily)
MNFSLGKKAPGEHQAGEESRLLSSRSDPAAFPALFRAHAPFVWRVLRRYGVASADLEDACQEVFMVVHRRLPEFEGRSSLRTWIYEIARRSALSQRRSHDRQPLLAGDLLTLPDLANAGPEQRLERERALHWLESALAQLPEDKREAFVLYELEEMTLAEVSAAQGCAINTVHYRVTSARDHIRAYTERAQIARPRALAAGRPQ